MRGRIRGRARLKGGAEARIEVRVRAEDRVGLGVGDQAQGWVGVTVTV